MELKQYLQKVTALLVKYRYAVMVLALGMVLMLLPSGITSAEPEATEPVPVLTSSDQEKLASILSQIRGAGRVEVLLSYASGERTQYQTDGSDDRTDTVTVTDSDRNQTGLVTQVDPARYGGAIIVCQGAGDPSVKLAIVDAVSKFTGLTSNQIAVLEMK